MDFGMVPLTHYLFLSATLFVIGLLVAMIGAVVLAKSKVD